MCSVLSKLVFRMVWLTQRTALSETSVGDASRNLSSGQLNKPPPSSRRRAPPTWSPCLSAFTAWLSTPMGLKGSEPPWLSTASTDSSGRYLLFVFVVLFFFAVRSVFLRGIWSRLKFLLIVNHPFNLISERKAPWWNSSSLKFSSYLLKVWLWRTPMSDPWV